MKPDLGLIAFVFILSALMLAAAFAAGYSVGKRDIKTVCMEAPAQPPTQSKRLFPDGAKGALR